MQSAALSPIDSGMSDKRDNAPPDDDRQRRLAEALRANLRRRKQQSRARSDAGRNEGIHSPDSGDSGG